MLKRGSIVKFKCGFWGDVNAYETNRLGVIEYSYGERYGDGNINGGYSVLNMETGSSSCWWDEDYLEFISEGGEDEIKKCKEIAKIREERNKNLDYIKEKMVSGELNLSATSILKLFHEIGYISSFERNGEYFCLFSDWRSLYPIFVAVFNKDYDTMIEKLSIFKEKYRDQYIANAIEFYNKVNS
jgi:hypothetical protein